MYNLNELIEKEIENGYGDANAQAKVCQDIILKAIANFKKQTKADELAIKKSEPLNIASTVISINNKKEQFDLVLMGVKTDSQLLLPKIVEGKKVTKEDEIVLSESFKEKSSV